MEKQLKSARNLANKIIQNLGRNDLDWTIQVSINSTKPNLVNYCCQIEAPANGLEPITWVCDSWEKLLSELEASSKNLDQEAVNKAWHESEIERAKALIKYHTEALSENKEENLEKS